MKHPLVTVYITNHNYGKYIERAVQSVLEQTMTDYEIIIIDDGSTDNSREIIENFSTSDNVKVIFQQRQGLNITNNIAMRSATGKYIMRLDADDYLDPNALLVMSNALERDDELGMVFPDYYLVDEKENIISIEKRHNFDSEVKLFDQPAHGACTMIRRDFLMQLNGYDERYECQDGYELWVKFIEHFKVNNINTPLFYYRQHGNNLTSNEERILSTRAKIKADFITKSKRSSLSTVVIIPVRDYKNSRKNLAFQKLQGRNLIDIKIDQAVEAKNTSLVVITSPDTQLGQYIKEQYKDNEKVLFVERDFHLARLNVDLTGTIEHIVNDGYLPSTPEAIMILTLEYPFISSAMIDDAINTMGIFKADSLISVRPETNLFFQHHGDGMKSILNQEKFSKLEREALYRYVGGITLVSTEYFLSKRKLIGGKVGHIVVDQKASQGIFSQFDLEIAKFLAEKHENINQIQVKRL